MYTEREPGVRPEREKPLILIVDDIHVNVQLLSIMLKKENFNIAVANDGQEALDRLNEIKPDLILLDIMMPEIDGFEVARRMKESSETDDIPIIFLTAKTDPNDVVKGFDLGAMDYVTKPFNNRELLARIGTHLELKRSKEELQNSYRELREQQQKIVELERRNSILAMVVTTNHELNQPLTVLSANLQLFETTVNKASLSADQQKFIANMNKAMKRMKEILEKYRNALSFRIEKYAGASNMVVFDDRNNPDKK